MLSYPLIPWIHYESGKKTHSLTSQRQVIKSGKFGVATVLSVMPSACFLSCSNNILDGVFHSLVLNSVQDHIELSCPWVSLCFLGKFEVCLRWKSRVKDCGVSLRVYLCWCYVIYENISYCVKSWFCYKKVGFYPEVLLGWGREVGSEH